MNPIIAKFKEIAPEYELTPRQASEAEKAVEKGTAEENANVIESQLQTFKEDLAEHLGVDVKDIPSIFLLPEISIRSESPVKRIVNVDKTAVLRNMEPECILGLGKHLGKLESGVTPPPAQSNMNPIHWLYKSILLREPDEKGIGWWTDHYKNGMKVSEIARYFEESPEKKSMG